jgi:hypothetical protein
MPVGSAAPLSHSDFGWQEFGMKNLKRLAAGSVAAAALGLAAIGVGGAVANASPQAQGVEWAQQPWIGPPGPGGPGGPGFGGPPPPPLPFYGAGWGGWDQPCLTGPFGFLRLCA